MKLNPIEGSFEQVAEVPAGINGIGYNTQDNFIYGFAAGELIRVHNDGTIDNLGTPAGFPGGGVLGDFDQSGNHYTITGTDLVITDVAPTPTTTTRPLIGALTPSNDIVYIDGKLYGTNGTSLMVIDIATGQATTTSLGIPSSIYGAGWASVDGKLYFSRNSDGAIYQILDYTTPTPTGVQVMVTGTSSTGNDGASCSLAPSVLDITAVDDTGTTLAGQPLTVPAESGLLTNDTPNGVTVIGNTQPGHGTVIVNSDGSYTYTPEPGFSGVDTFTYTITDSAGNTATATVTITVMPSPLAEATDEAELSTLASSGKSMVVWWVVSTVVLTSAYATKRARVYSVR